MALRQRFGAQAMIPQRGGAHGSRGTQVNDGKWLVEVAILAAFKKDALQNQQAPGGRAFDEDAPVHVKLSPGVAQQRVGFRHAAGGSDIGHMSCREHGGRRSPDLFPFGWAFSQAGERGREQKTRRGARGEVHKLLIGRDTTMLQIECRTAHLIGAALALALSVTASDGGWQFHPGPRTAGGIRGAALGPDGSVYVWGDALEVWKPPEGRSVKLARGPFGEGGCTLDVNRDGRTDVVVQRNDRAGTLVWLDASSWQAHAIDTGTVVQDAAAAVLFGRRGVLVVHRSAQVRFYEIPVRPEGPWPYREIYSFYTPSRQGGLLVADVDGDGRQDIVCGNYWIRSPERYELPWRLFAINTYSETPEAAMLRMILAGVAGRRGENLVVAERERSDARLAWFARPADVHQLWREHPLGAGLRLVYPQGLTAADLDGDGRVEIAVGENHGSRSRLLILYNRGGGRFGASEISRGTPVLALWAGDVNGDGRPDLMGAGPQGVFWWENRLQRRR